MTYRTHPQPQPWPRPQPVPQPHPWPLEFRMQNLFSDVRNIRYQVQNTSIAMAHIIYHIMQSPYTVEGYIILSKLYTLYQIPYSFQLIVHTLYCILYTPFCMLSSLNYILRAMWYIPKTMQCILRSVAMAYSIYSEL